MQTEKAVTTNRLGIILLAAGTAAYIIACLVTHPLGVTIIDEVHYFTEAVAIWRGLPLGSAASYVLENGMIPFQGPLYPPGWPALLAPLTGLPWPWPFALAPVFHVLTAGVLGLLLKRRGLSPAWALLALAQPSLLAFSRTMMGESLAVFQTALLLLVAEGCAPFLLGVVAGAAPLIKLSQLLVAAPFVAIWLWERPRASRTRDTLLAAVGSSFGLAAYALFSRSAYGHWIGAGYTPAYLSIANALPWLGLEIVQLSGAWPLLTLGLLRSRRAELGTVLTVVLFLAFYGSYHYQGPSLLATLIVGARLLSPAILLLIPGYAALLSELRSPLRATALAVLATVASAAPFLVLRGVSARRLELEKARNQVLAALRPPCLLAYSKPALKLLLPLPTGKKLHGPEDIARVNADLSLGVCVDLLDPLSEPSTYQHPPVYPDTFARLLEAWPYRDRSPSKAMRLFWLDPSDKNLVGTGQD